MPRLALALVLSGSLAVSLLAGREQLPEIPIVPGVNFVLAVSNQTTPGEAGRGILHGDYEMVVSITGVTPEAVTQTAFLDGTDAAGVHRRIVVPRIVSASDLAHSNVQVLGFHSDDPPSVSGTTSLGPSLTVTRSLARTGATPYSFLNFVNQGMVSGTLRATTRVKFPVLLNGARVQLDAIHATGQMALGGVSRPFETVILDHPTFPLSLRVAYGARGGAIPFTPEFTREIVRIDVPIETPARTAAGVLEKTCRLEVPGIYFDFNLATLKPESTRGLADMAAVLEQLGDRTFVIEGHTDSIGGDRYNEQLSARRADAVKAALVSDHRVAATRLSTAGFGKRRPIESNDTLAGRARNRRVELVCASPR